MLCTVMWVTLTHRNTPQANLLARSIENMRLIIMKSQQGKNLQASQQQPFSGSSGGISPLGQNLSGQIMSVPSRPAMIPSSLATANPSLYNGSVSNPYGSASGNSVTGQSQIYLNSQVRTY